VNHGQCAAAREQVAASQIAQALGIELRVITVNGLAVSIGEIVGRNALLLDLGLMAFPWDCGLVAIGVHSGTSYVDCSTHFLERMSDVYRLYADDRIRIDAPFATWKKGDLFAYSRDANLPISLTYSCELGTVPACGHCTSCRDIEAIRAC